MKKKTNESKAWASFRIRGIQTTLKSLGNHPELSGKILTHLFNAFSEINKAVDELDQERIINERK